MSDVHYCDANIEIRLGGTSFRVYKGSSFLSDGCTLMQLFDGQKTEIFFSLSEIREIRWVD